MTNKDKTGGERQSRLRKARKKWLEEHGYKSSEGLIGALMRGEVVLQTVSVPIPDDATVIIAKALLKQIEDEENP